MVMKVHYEFQRLKPFCLRETHVTKNVHRHTHRHNFYAEWMNSTNLIIAKEEKKMTLGCFQLNIGTTKAKGWGLNCHHTAATPFNNQ